MNNPAAPNFESQNNDKMNKQSLIEGIAESVQRKHPWRIDHKKYFDLFHEYPREFVEELATYDALVEKSRHFKLCELRFDQVKIEIRLTLDELIAWELSLDKWEESRKHDIVPGDIKKILKSKRD